jgi:hypothetical protein
MNTAGEDHWILLFQEPEHMLVRDGVFVFAPS